MRRAGIPALAAVLTLAVVAAGSARNLPSTTYVDKNGGYSITIPTTWQPIPRSVAAVQALIAKLKKKKSTTDLASYYAKILGNKSGRADLSNYVFQAFAWPDSLDSPVPIEVSVGIVPTKSVIDPKQLPAIGNEFAKAFLANKGAKVTQPKTVKLTAGPAEVYEGIVPIGAGFTDGLRMYLIPHGKVLYELAFRIEGSQLATAKLFDSIALHFKLA
jgi:hypothetical protein